MPAPSLLSTSRAARRRPIRLAALLAILLVLLPAHLTVPVRAAAIAPSPALAAPADGTLIRDPATGRISIVWSGRKHWINSPPAFATLGLSMANVTNLAAAALAAIPEGNAIGLNTVAGGLPWPLALLRCDPVLLSLDTPTVSPGQNLPLHGAGFAPGEAITLSAPNGVGLHLVADHAGAFQVNVPVPAGVPLGLHHLYAQGASSGLFGVQVFFVNAPAPAPSVSASPNPVGLGTNLLVTGSGFAAGEQVRAFLAGGVADAAATASGAGDFGPVAVLVPRTLSPGAHTLRTFGENSHRYSLIMVNVTASLPTATPTPAPTPVVIPRLSVSPTTASPGSQIALTGSGFAANEIVLIRLNGSLVQDVRADGSGNFAGLLISVPSSFHDGVYSVSAIGAVSGKTANAGLRISVPQPARASLSISPVDVTPGSRVAVAGTGFLPGETVLIRLNNALVRSAVASAAGLFTDGSFVVPTGLAPGRYGVSAVGARSGRAASAVLDVHAAPRVIAPQVSLSAGIVGRGARLSLSGRGFAAGETILIRVDNALRLAVRADGSGAFSATFIASTVVGRHGVSATGAVSGRVADTSFLVLPPVTPGIGLSPSKAHRKDEVRVNGNNFLPGEIVLISFRGHLEQAATADNRGRFAGAAFRVPSDTPYGASEVTLLGARSGRSAHAILVISPTPRPAARAAAAPTTLHRGATVLLSGRGFDGNEIVLISFRGRLMRAVTADRHGNFSRVSLKIPGNSPYGTASITLTGARSHRSTTVTVRIVPAPSISIALSAGTVRRGASLTVSGHGFAGGEIVLLYLHGKLIQAATADRHGNFSRIKLVVSRQTPVGFTVVRAVGGRSRRHAEAKVRII